METIRLGVIGLGGRGSSVISGLLLGMKKYRIVSVCDIYPDRVESVCETVKNHTGERPFGTVDYSEILDKDKIDAVLIMTSWESHIEIACRAMRAGIPTGLEVGGAYNIEECFELVKAQRESGTRFMFLENCCYGRYELMVLNMVRMGLFGEIVHCDGGYQHDLRDEILLGEENRHYRLRNYMGRNCENYPTHELGPIAKILNINNGNRMLYLTSMSSRASGLNDYAKRHPEIQEKFRTCNFRQGDIVTTDIMCADGATISLILDTTLPRPYSRRFTVHGTKGLYCEDSNYIYLDTDFGADSHFNWVPQWNNAEKYLEKYEHPIWKKFMEDGVRGGHGGMDYLVYDAFADYVINGGKSPIDVYDAAAWMAVTPLSAKSIELGSAPVEFPDFTKI